MAQLVETKPILTTLPVFNKGPFDTKCLSVDTSSNDSSLPKPCLIITPVLEGTYPVILFFHGFMMQNSFYSDLLQHVSSHGYIIVAPQLYQSMMCSGPDEVAYAGEIVNWLPKEKGLQSLLLIEKVKSKANLDKLVLVGHSRGGKTAFTVALGLANTDTSSLNFSALIGIDPVAAPSKSWIMKPEILTNCPQSFKFDIPVTVIGTGLGSKKNFIMPPCAPEDLNHEEFFSECKPPRAHFVTADYGHNDMLNDNNEGITGIIAACACKNGPKGGKDLMRNCVGGIVVAFLKFCFGDEKSDFMTIVQDPSVAPVKLFPPPVFDEAPSAF